MTIMWLIVAIPIVLLVASSYFKKTPGGVKDGIILGVWFVMIAIVLDMAIIVPLFYEGDYANYWSSVIGVFGGISVIIICTGIATRIRNKNRRLESGSLNLNLVPLIPCHAYADHDLQARYIKTGPLLLKFNHIQSIIVMQACLKIAANSYKPRAVTSDVPDGVKDVACAGRHSKN